MPDPDRGAGVNDAELNLVLEGGGVKGIGLLGAAVALAEGGRRFRRIAGTSAGAVVGSLLAATAACDGAVADLVGVMQALDYTRFRDPTLLDRLGAPGQAAQLVLSGGVFAGDYLVSWLSGQLAERGVRTFADLRLPGVPDDAPVEQRYRLVVVAADISRHELVQLPWDYPRYGLAPDDQPVAEAVRASMSIPFFFRPAVLHGAAGTGSSTLVDGGLLWNFPVGIFDRIDEPVAAHTVGVKLSAKVVTEPVARPAGFGAFGVALDAMATLLAEHDRYHLDDEGVTARTVFVDTFGVSAVNFGIDRATQDRLYASGQSAARRFLASQRPDPAGR